MSANSTGVPLGAWLAELDDGRLMQLLRLRPDLTQPPPGSIAALAARAAARQSVKAATDDLDFLHLSVLDALLTLHADTTAVTTADLTKTLGERADGEAVPLLRDDVGRDADLVVQPARPRAAGDVVDYVGKLDLIATGYAEAAIAVNNAVHYVDPSARVNPGHSTNMKVFKE